jgi:hypothetical protein
MKGRILVGSVFCVALAAAALLVGLASAASLTSYANTPWTRELVETYVPDRDIGHSVSMAPDGAGGAVIAYQTAITTGLFTAHWRPGGVTHLAYYDPKAATHNSIAAFSSGGANTVTVVYFDYSDHTLRWLTMSYDEDWASPEFASGDTIATGSNNVGDIYPSLQYDSTGVAHLAYHHSNLLNTDDELVYAYWVGSGGDCPSSVAWECETIATGEGVGQYASLDLDGGDNPHIAYYDGDNGWPYEATYVGTAGNCGGGKWFCRSLQWGSLDTGKHVSLAVTDSGNSRVAYYNVTSGTLGYARYVAVGGNCGYTGDPIYDYQWDCIEIEPIGTLDTALERPIGIALDGDNRPVIAYQNAAGAEDVLRTARPRESYGIQAGNCGPEDGLWQSWYCETVDAGGSFASHTASAVAMDVNSLGLATVFYRQRSLRSDEYNLRVACQRVSVFLPLILNSSP